MAYRAVLAAIVVLACLQLSIAYTTPKACKTQSLVLTPRQEATETGGDCFDTGKEKELYKLAVAANEQLIVSQRDARKNLGKYTNKQLLGTIDASSVDGDGKAEACWLVSDHHINLYSPLWKIPLVVAYTLTREEVRSKTIKLPSQALPFRSDLCLSPEQALQCDTFSTLSKNSDDTKTYPGQLLSPGHFRWNQSALLNAYVLSSVIPSRQELHKPQGVWAQLDKEAESLAEKYGTVYIASGPVIKYPKHPRWLSDLSGSVVNPKELFRVFAWCKSPDKKSCDPQARCYIINKKTLEKRFYSTESGNSITKIEMAIECETQIEFKFQDKVASVQVGKSRKQRATECSQIVSQQSVKEATKASEVFSVEEIAKLQKSVDCKSAGMKLFKGITFKQQGVRCLADGCLKEPFGTPDAKVCGLEGNKEEFAKIEPSLKATFYVGNAGQIQGKGVIVINASRPKDFYYMFKTNRITLPSILAAFGNANVALPPVLSRITVAAGASVSFSSRKRKISKMTLFSGHGIQGEGRVYNRPSKIKIKIEPQKTYMLTLHMPVLSLDQGKIKLYHSFKKASGPILECVIQMSPKFKVDMIFRAFASVLGMEDVVKVRLSGGSYEFLISGKILGKLQGNFQVYSSKGKLEDVHFHVKGFLGKSTKDEIQTKVKAALKRAADEGSSKVKAVNDEIAPIVKEQKQLQELLENSMAKANLGTKNLMKTQQEVTKLQKKANTTCGTTCKKVWVGCSQPFCCGRDPISKKCTCHQDRWVTKCKQITSASCKAINKQCEKTRGLMREKLSEAVKARDAAAVKSAALNSSVKVEKDKLSKLESAKKALEDKRERVKIAYAVGIKAAHKIIHNGLEGNEYIKEIKFDVDIDVALTGVFPCEVKLIYAKEEEKVIKTKIDVRKLATVAKVLANLLIPGLEKYVS